MKIQFFDKKTDKILTDTDFDYFVMNDRVWRNNHKYYESHGGTLSFEDFILVCPEVSWRTIQ